MHDSWIPEKFKRINGKVFLEQNIILSKLLTLALNIRIGIKKMKAYKCNLTLNELNKRRERFWKLKTNPKNLNGLFG